jgi:leucyl aminopeptidase
MKNSWISSFQFKKPAKKPALPVGYAYFLGQNEPKTFEAIVEEHALDWQLDSLRRNEQEMVYFSGKNGPVWILKAKDHRQKGHWGLQNESGYSWSRDMLGGLGSYFKAHHLNSVIMEFHGTDDEQDLGALTGLEISSYNFRDLAEKREVTLPKIYISKPHGSFKNEVIKNAEARGAAMNMARHLVNLPPNQLNPSTFKNIVKDINWGRNTQVEIWNEARLKKENCGLLLAVGGGSPNPPCLIHIRYRPAKKAGRPIAFVGKGITFDTGGLDIKPSAGMRLMKKDMGGAGAVLGLAYWVSQSKLSTPCDFYLAIAENSVDGNSYRPSDVVLSRSGLRIEIDNTDAEGRLVLADTLDVAATQKGAHEPETIINVATLTGAIKVALGAEIGGLFSNDDNLADNLLDSSQRSGDFLWRMPLPEKYFSGLSSPFADFKNSADGFGGAITAALFLQRFVRGKKWAHLDIYAWADKSSGAISGVGGNGQSVQCLIDYLSNLA